MSFKILVLISSFITLIGFIDCKCFNTAATIDTKKNNNDRGCCSWWTLADRIRPYSYGIRPYWTVADLSGPQQTVLIPYHTVADLSGPQQTVLIPYQTVADRGGPQQTVLIPQHFKIVWIIVRPHGQQINYIVSFIFNNKHKRD